VAVFPSEEGAKLLLNNASARDFIADAFGHLKFIAWVDAAMPLFQKAGIAQDLDEGCIQVTGAESVAQFLIACRKLRQWKREESVVS
jgi:catalase